MFRFILFFLFVTSSALSYADNFPKPVELERDVNFWVRVYTEIDTRGGFIHDSRNLSVVYSTVSLKGGPRANKRQIKKIKAKYASILKKLAQGKRNNLSRDEQKVLDMWGGEDVSNKRLGSAANNIRFQRGQSDRFYRGLERSGEWRTYINQTFLDLNMPVELAVLPHVESSFNPKAYSHVGAAGIWQFIRSTGRRYMQVDYLIDERMDPFISTKAAAKLLGHNYQLTKSWPLALTAYNHGVASMRRAINKLGTRDIATIVRKYKGRSFGFASRNFYVAFLAALEVDNNPEKYFGSINYAKPIEYELVKINSYLYAADIAKYLKINKSQLELHNRSLRGTIWSGAKRVPKNFWLRVPKELLSKSAKQLIAAIPVEHQYKVQTPDLFHHVVRGDTISEIANQYGFKVRDIMAANGMSSGHFIRAGQKLRLPVKDKSGAVVLAANPNTKKQVTEKSVPKIEAVKKLENKQTEIAAEEKQAVENGQAITIASVKMQQEQLDVSVVAEAEVDVEEEVSLFTDPADYTVREDMTIEVQASETLGHYADWLDLRASRLREINKLKFGRPVVVGNRLLLDFSDVSIQEFENRRIAFQKNLQEEFFAQYRIESTYQHKIKNGESLWVLALRQFKVPIWLLRQHNPDIDFNRMRAGIVIVVPKLIEVERNVVAPISAG
ncbi:MAG: transglycosylase SLT domain-containing protein [Gammaproteobacteria bacterium]|nr:transglycosylase SLT domain-containing protein [Gammaproteobacteria bacterium]